MVDQMLLGGINTRTTIPTTTQDHPTLHSCYGRPPARRYILWTDLGSLHYQPPNQAHSNKITSTIKLDSFRRWYHCTSLFSDGRSLLCLMCSV